MVAALLLAFLAAVANASSSLLQRQANRQRDDRLVVTKPAWLLGIGAALFSFVLQATALSFGSLAAIEPVLALELVLVVVGAGIFFKAPIRKLTWVSIGLMTLGVVGLIAALDPQETEHLTISAMQWSVAIGASTLLIAACALGSHFVRSQTYRAALLGVGTGVSLGFASALLKAVMLTFKQHGFTSVVTSWQVYMALVLGVFSFWLLQVTLRAGKVVISQPGITLADPLIAIAWGRFIYSERMNSGMALLIAFCMAAVLIVGAVILARAFALAHEN